MKSNFLTFFFESKEFLRVGKKNKNLTKNGFLKTRENSKDFNPLFPMEFKSLGKSV